MYHEFRHAFFFTILFFILFITQSLHIFITVVCFQLLTTEVPDFCWIQFEKENINYDYDDLRKYCIVYVKIYNAHQKY